MYLLLLLSLLALSTANISGGGLGAQYKWVTWSQAKDIAAQEGNLKSYTVDAPILRLSGRQDCQKTAGIGRTDVL